LKKIHIGLGSGLGLGLGLGLGAIMSSPVGGNSWHFFSFHSAAEKMIYTRNKSSAMSNTTESAEQPNNNWTKAKEDKLLEWQQQSRLHSLGHGRSQEIYIKKNDQIQIPSIVVGAVAVFMDGVALIWEEQHVPFVITALLMTVLVTICNGILQATKPVEKASEHEDMAKGYNKIILQIDAMIAKEYNERQNGSAFLTKIEEELIALKTGGVKIPSTVWTTVKNDFMAGECDFQKLKDEAGFGRPFRHTIKLTKPPSQHLHLEETKVDVGPAPDDELPRFELRIDNDPKTRMIEKIFFDYQMSRFG
jgi:hypothetical protein